MEKIMLDIATKVGSKPFLIAPCLFIFLLVGATFVNAADNQDSGNMTKNEYAQTGETAVITCKNACGKWDEGNGCCPNWKGWASQVCKTTWSCPQS